MIGARFNRSDRSIFIILSQLIIYFNSVVLITADKNSTIEETRECGGEFSGYQYTISSPNYPEPYPDKQNCVYTLRGSHLAKCDQVFNLQFLDFSLPPSENCVEDYVEIGDRSLYCGKVAGIRKYLGKDNSLVLRFHSGARHGLDKGFKIFVTTLPCSEARINDKNKAESTEQSGTTLKNEETTEKFINEKISTRNDLESFLEGENSYRIYRPEIDFTIEDNRKFIRGEIPSPPRVESLDTIENDPFLKIQENPNESNKKILANSLEIPVHQSKLFREPISTRLEIVTPSTIKNSQESKSSKISAYLFVPPNSEKDSTKNDVPVRISVVNFTRDFPKNDAVTLVTSPPTEILLPIRWNTIFRENGPTNKTRKLELAENRQRTNEKFLVPARSYGVPDESYYRPIKVFDEEIKTGEVLDNSRDIVDCQGKINLEPDLEVTANYRENNQGSIDNIREIGKKYSQATTYGTPILSYPSDIRNGNVDITLTTKYGQPAGNYPNDNYPGIIENDRPNDWLPSANFVPSKNVINDYPIVNSNVGTTLGNPGNIAGYSQCCNNVYSAQRFLLASPGFPSIFYSGNTYDCVYSIRPYSSNICQIRFNFKFFNHGTDDRFCIYGHIEIDGRRICGCKKGLSIISAVTTSFQKIIRVRYTGQPRTKFNGFLIEVIQEPCSNGYPYLSRSKKDVGNSSSETSGFALSDDSRMINNTLERTKRNLGYVYPKPNFGLDDSGFSQPWNSGNSINGHQLWNQGDVGGNLFSPLLTCQALSFFDWTVAAKEVYLRNGRCVRNGGNTGYPSGNWNPGNPGTGGPGIINPGYPGNGGPGTINPGYPGNGGPGTINPGYPGNGGPGTINPGYPGNGGPGTINPGYPGNGGPGIINPGYPGNGGPGTINPGYPGNGGPGTINPGYPGNGGPGIINPGYPGNGGPGTINPGYPGNGGPGTINPGYPGNGGPGTINPGYPGNGGPGTINPGYPGNGGPGIINPGYPGNGGPGIINPGYPGNGGPGTINPGYPGNGGPGTINPGYPGNGGPGTINPGYPGNGGPGTINPGYPGNGGSGTINPGYPGSGWNFPSVRCEDVNIIEGIISSPQYPTNYPNNVKKCFRFYKAPDSCQLELLILDFDLENSAGCWKDYVAFSGQNRRYCGRTLAGSKALFDISRTNIVEMYFVSDGFGSGRGFSAGYSQIPCRALINP